MQPGDESPPPYYGDDIIVTGRFSQAPYLFQFVVWGWAEQAYNAGFARRSNYYYSEYDTGLLTPPEADEDKHEVTSTIQRELNPKEQAAYEKFLGEVAAADKLISSIPDNAIVRLPSGVEITGHQLKTIWAKTDFVINDEHHSYRNETERGESDFRGGDPQISFNIDLVTGYVDNPSAEGRGGLWVIFHELGHMTDNGRFLNLQYASTHDPQDNAVLERYANDFARVVTEFYTGTHVDLPVRSGDPDPYSPQPGNMVFQSDYPAPADPFLPAWKFDSFDGLGLETYA